MHKKYAGLLENTLICFGHKHKENKWLPMCVYVPFVSFVNQCLEAWHQNHFYNRSLNASNSLVLLTSHLGKIKAIRDLSSFEREIFDGAKLQAIISLAIYLFATAFKVMIFSNALVISVLAISVFQCIMNKYREYKRFQCIQKEEIQFVETVQKQVNEEIQLFETVQGQVNTEVEQNKSQKSISLIFSPELHKQPMAAQNELIEKTKEPLDRLCKLIDDRIEYLIGRVSNFQLGMIYTKFHLNRLPTQDGTKENEHQTILKQRIFKKCLYLSYKLRDLGACSLGNEVVEQFLSLFVKHPGAFWSDQDEIELNAYYAKIKAAKDQKEKASKIQS